MARRSRLRQEIETAARAPFYLATVTAIDTGAGTITVEEAGGETTTLPAALGSYPAVGATAFVMLNGDEPIVIAQLGDSGGMLSSIPTGIPSVDDLTGVTPSTFSPPSSVVFLTSDEKLYRWNGSAWTAAVAAVDISGTITETQIANDAITTPKIAANAVTTAELAANAVTANELAAGAVTTNKLDAGAVTAAKIAAGTITAHELAVIELEVGQYIESTTYTAGSSGWHIDQDGSAEFNDVTVRGVLDASIVQANTITSSSTDLTVNGGGESGTTNWQAPGSTLTSDTGSPHSGSRAIKCVFAGAGSVLYFNIDGVEPEAAYNIDLWQKIASGSSNVRIRTQYFDVSNNPLDATTIIVEPIVDTTYRNISFATRSPANAYRLQLSWGANAADTLYVDDVTCYRTTYGDGGYLAPDVLHARGDVFDVTGYVMPVGALIPWAGIVSTSTDSVYANGAGGGNESGTVVTSGYPAGWLPCDGRAVSRTTYRRLYLVIGTTYGTGDGSTTFNLPDLRGRVPVCLDNLGGTDAGRLSVSNTLGGTGGAQTHTLTVAELPLHDHAIQVDNAGFFAAGTNRGIGQNSGTTDGTSQGAGSGSAHNNMQPYILVNYLIKA